MIIAVDFDGTIVEHRYPDIGRERPFAIDTLSRLQSQGHIIILWTIRRGEYLKAAVEFCESKGLRFNAVNRNYGISEDVCFTGKVCADIYIDDRNVGGLPDWGTIYEIIQTGETFESYYESHEYPKPRKPFWKLWQ